jgi:hypothetical protein
VEIARAMLGPNWSARRPSVSVAGATQKRRIQSHTGRTEKIREAEVRALRRVSQPRSSGIVRRPDEQLFELPDARRRSEEATEMAY